MDPKTRSVVARVPLATLRKGDQGVVPRVMLDDAALVGDIGDSTIGRRLIELGFVPGERVQIVEVIWPGGDPMAVRIGSSVFALRRREARDVLVEVELPA
ncbi:MAG: ferrous iron transport protein A [Gammaproteobacteria bacterium]|nr:ferrous iron transport protein A [Gammaproteobacteria bacterium]